MKPITIVFVIILLIISFGLIVHMLTDHITPANNYDSYYGQEPQDALLPYIPSIGSIHYFAGHPWRVLDEIDSRVLLLYNGIWERRSYNETMRYITWENSDLRNYLNNEFLRNFPRRYRSRIVELEIHNSPNPWFDTLGGSATTDMVFILSVDEVVRFFGDSGQLGDRPNEAFYIYDDYNRFRIAEQRRGHDRGTLAWWLRTPAENGSNVSFVSNTGVIQLHTYPYFPPHTSSNITNSSHFGVRPAFWIDLTPNTVLATRVALFVMIFHLVVLIIFCMIKILNVRVRGDAVAYIIYASLCGFYLYVLDYKLHSWIMFLITLLLIVIVGVMSWLLIDKEIVTSTFKRRAIRLIVFIVPITTGLLDSIALPLWGIELLHDVPATQHMIMTAMLLIPIVITSLQSTGKKRIVFFRISAFICVIAFIISVFFINHMLIAI